MFTATFCKHKHKTQTSKNSSGSATVSHILLHIHNVAKAREQGFGRENHQNKIQFWQKKVRIRFHSTGPFKVIKSQKSIPGRVVKLSQSFSSHKTPRIARYRTGSSYFFLFSITCVCTFSFKFNHTFMFIINFLCYLNSLIGF